ncbi:MAG: hypothetical protein KAJ21_04005 [Thermoplasmatales archaeon]|nr:hypothetical protein [Thermoplasmatales archaeon]
MNFKKNHFKKIIILTIIILFITLSVNPSLNAINENNIISNKYDNKNDCYGFIIPLPESDIIAEKPEIQYSTMNLINDLLRLNISVYWLANSISLKIKDINSEENPKDLIFNPGTFIIPFTGNNSIDIKIIAVIYDYNISHEIHKNDIVPIKSYMILQQLNLETPYKLFEPKIAYYYGDGVYSRSLNWYVYTLYKSGFLTNDFLYDEEVIEELNYDDYNIFIWPGGEILEDINSDIGLVTRILKQNTIRDFVADGGGYVGSCYGAFAASSGIRFLPLTLLNYYFPIIPSVGYLSIQDCTTALAISCTFNISVSDINNPVIYGSDEILYNSQLRGGPVFTWLGKNTQSLATIKEVNSTIWTHWFRDLFSANSTISKMIIDLWVKFTSGKTIWTTSEYENGKIVTFGDHPELGHINLNRIVHNAVFYVSSIQQSELISDFSYPIQDLESIGNQSLNIYLDDTISTLFSEINNDIEYNLNHFNSYNNRTDILFNIIFEMIDQNELNFSFAIEIFVSGFWEFITTINRSRNYLDDPINYEDTSNNLIKLDSIYNQIETNNTSIKNFIIELKDDISNKLKEVTNINDEINNDLYLLENKIEHYDNTANQNESIIEICSNLWYYSKLIDRLCSNLYFESLKTLRESWYNYETI